MGLLRKIATKINKDAVAPGEIPMVEDQTKEEK